MTTSTEPDDGVINLEHVAELVRVELPDVRVNVDQTGGNVATLIVGEAYEYEYEAPWLGKTITEGAVPVQAGPGWFDGPGWTEGRGHVDDFSVSYDQDVEDDAESVTTYEDVAPAEREQRIATDLVRLYRSHPRFATAGR